MNPRLAVILGRLVIGGAILDTLQVLNYLQHDFDIMLITGSNDKDEYEATYLTDNLPKVTLKRVKGFSGKINPLEDLAAFRTIKAELQKFKPHIVHTHTPKAGLIGRLAAFSAKVPATVHTYHGMIFRGYYNKVMSQIVIQLEHWLTKRTTAIVALSENQKHQLVNTYKVTSDSKVSIIPIGIETNQFSTDKETKRAAFRKKYALQESDLAIGIIGRIVPIKNHLFFLKVVKTLLSKNPAVRFFIVGDGALRAELEKECHRLAIDFSYYPQNPKIASLTFTSWIINVSEAVCGLDIITLTSFSEGTPVSLLEAQAAGKPVVTTRAGAVENIVLQNQTGFISDLEDVESFTKYLEVLIADSSLRNQMGLMGISFVKENFEKQRQVADYRKLYLNLLEIKN